MCLGLLTDNIVAKNLVISRWYNKKSFFLTSQPIIDLYKRKVY